MGRIHRASLVLLTACAISGCESGSSEGPAPITFTPAPAPAGTGFVALYAPPVDVVQDVLLRTFKRIDSFEDRGKGALRGYLRRSVMNRIHDEMRKVIRRPTGELEERLFNLPGEQPGPFESAVDGERARHYKAALATLTDEERVLVVGRIELGFNYDQLALISGRSTPEAARQAVRRAVKKLAERMPRARGPR